MGVERRGTGETEIELGRWSGDGNKEAPGKHEGGEEAAREFMIQACLCDQDRVSKKQNA